MFGCLSSESRAVLHKNVWCIRGPQLCFYSTGAPDAAEQGESDFQQGSTSPTMITLTSPPYQLCVELHKSPLPLYVRFHLPLPTARWASHVPLAI
eukprot:scaffold135735_cov22-Tisochrysis_lutea.AAC.1